MEIVNPTKKISLGSKMSGTVNKLRFMQKASEQTPTDALVEAIYHSSERWALSTVDPSMLFSCREEEKKLKVISLMARRSYGGANPYVEQQMVSLEKSKKRPRS
jgi:hypothetical protein